MGPGAGSMHAQRATSVCVINRRYKGTYNSDLRSQKAYTLKPARMEFARSQCGYQEVYLKPAFEVAEVGLDGKGREGKGKEWWEGREGGREGEGGCGGGSVGGLG